MSPFAYKMIVSRLLSFNRFRNFNRNILNFWRYNGNKESFSLENIKFKVIMISKINLLLLASVVVGIFQIRNVIGGATEEQMWATCELMRDVCFPKFPKLSKEVADGIRAGNLPDEKDPKCYVNCILEMMQTMKKGKFLYEASLKQVELLLPDNYKDEYRAGMAKCKDIANGIKNNCDSAYAIFTCLRAEIKTFVFP